MPSRTNHPGRGCHCAAHEELRIYMREYQRKRDKSGKRRGYRSPNSPAAQHDRRVSIEQAIARGMTTSQIMRALGIDYETVQKVREYLDTAVA